VPSMADPLVCSTGGRLMIRVDSASMHADMGLPTNAHQICLRCTVPS
jgi:hypothetical protein